MLTLLHAHPFLIFAPLAVLAFTALLGAATAALVEAAYRRRPAPARGAQIFYFSAVKMPLRSAPAAVLAPTSRAANGG